MPRVLYVAAFAAGACLGLAPSAVAQNDFEWTGQLAPGQRIEIQDLNGSIHATAAPDGNIIVTAVKKAGRRGSPTDVKIETAAGASGVTVCVIYDGSSGCRASGAQEGSSSSKNNDTSVEFTVRVPAGVVLSAHTVNGSIDASGLQSDTDAATVNGSVTVATSSSARASTVNGSIKAALGQAPKAGTFSTTNGDVTVQLPTSANANVRASTVNGNIKSDFPLLIDTKRSPKQASGAIGAGGQELAISTVNGSVRLVRR